MPEKKTMADLRTVAERVGLAPCSVSAVLNQTRASEAIPQHTKDRIFRAAAELNYRPNLSARSLRTKRTHMVAVVSNDFGSTPVGAVVAGMERFLRGKGYLLALGSLDHPSGWTSLSFRMQQRGIEGLIAVGSTLPRELIMPSVSVHLGALNLTAPLANATGAWLAQLGEAAAAALIEKIETKDASRHTRIIPKFPPAPFTANSTALAQA